MLAKSQELDSGAAVRRRFYLTGMLTAAVYLITILFYHRGPQSHGRTAKELFAWFFVITLLALFWKGYLLVSESVGTLRLERPLIWFAALFCLLTLLVFPFHSTDVFGYINRGWQQVHYHQNPYVAVVGEIPNWQQDPMLWDHWIYNPNPYGFLFTLLAALICRISYGHWWQTLLLFKAVNILAFALTAYLIWRAAERLGHRRPVVALYLCLWNPLVLMHHIANGHNDILTGCLIALGLYLAVAGTWFWVIPVLVAATLLKYAPALLIPMALVLVVRHKGWKTAALSCLVGALLFLAVSLPFLKDWQQFRLEDIKYNATLLDNSLHSLLIHIFENIARLIPSLEPFHAAVNSFIKTIIRLGFLLFLLPQFYAVWRERTTRVFLEKATLVMFVLFCAATSKFNGWYMGMLLPMALFLEERHWLRRLIIIITATQLLSLTFFKQAYMLNYFALIMLPCWYVYRQMRKERESTQSSPETLRPAHSGSTGGT